MNAKCLGMHIVIAVCTLVVSFHVRPANATPVIAVVAQNHGTEPTDFLVPFSIMLRAGARVHALSTAAGPVTLHPGHVQVSLPHTLQSFDRAVPSGADVVIVPAVHDPSDATLVTWLNQQRAKGALLMSICDGAKVLAATGALDGKNATAHWHAIEDLRDDYPKVAWRQDRRYVFDGKVASTSGVSASIPGTLALLEHVMGRVVADRVARDIGISDWQAAHDGHAYKLSARFIRTATANKLLFWRHEQRSLLIQDDIDDAAFALVLDAYSRTYRSSVGVTTSTGKPVQTRAGLRIHPQAAAGHRRIEPALMQQPTGQVLDATLHAIRAEYGSSTAEFVALQLEYPWVR